MDFYDGRWRPFYLAAVAKAYDPIIFGPYANPSADNKFYALTLSQAIEFNSKLHGVMNHDINLNFQDKYDDFLNLNSTHTHYFITTFNARLMVHSRIRIENTTDTITKAEFSDNWLALSEEPTGSEPIAFNNTMLPIIKALNSTQVSRYKRFGESFLAVTTPLHVRYLNNSQNEDVQQRAFSFTLAANEDALISDITDKTELKAILYIWIGIFTGVFVILVTFTIYVFVKISTRALTPIRLLNFKVSTLVKTNGELNLEHTRQSMTSQEALKMYEMFSELITAKKFTSNKIFQNNDAVAIMDYAEAHTVFADNKRAQGICMTNIAHIYYRHEDYEKASKSYNEAAECAYNLMKFDATEQSMRDNIKLYCKRKYYANVCLFMDIKKKKEVIEKKIPEVQKELDFTKKLLSDKMKSVNDLLIMLNLHSSYWLMMTRRLISAERDLHIAINIFNRTDKISQEDRPDIPVIPKTILRQRILFQKALIMKAYGKINEAAMMLTNLLKLGKVYDPLTRKEILVTLHNIFSTHPTGNLIEKLPEAKNIALMLHLFERNKNKNVVLCIDSLKDQMFEQKKQISVNIFECLNQEDKVSLISTSRKVNIIFSLINKSKNTIQLNNQLKHLEPSQGKRLFLLKSLKDSIKELIKYGNSNGTNNDNWIICIISTYDLSSFKNTDDILQLQNRMIKNRIGIIFITVGIESDNKLRKFHKYLNFGGSTVFMNDPTEKQIQVVLTNISNVNMMHENLIYEKF